MKGLTPKMGGIGLCVLLVLVSIPSVRAGNSTFTLTTNSTEIVAGFSKTPLCLTHDMCTVSDDGNTTIISATAVGFSSIVDFGFLEDIIPEFIRINSVTYMMIWRSNSSSESGVSVQVLTDDGATECGPAVGMTTALQSFGPSVSIILTDCNGADWTQTLLEGLEVGITRPAFTPIMTITYIEYLVDYEYQDYGMVWVWMFLIGIAVVGMIVILARKRGSRY